MTHRVQYNPHLHVSLHYAVLVEAAFGDHIDEPLLKVPVAQIDDGMFRRRRHSSRQRRRPPHERIGRRPATPRPSSCLNPNASDLLPLRKWERAKFADLGPATARSRFLTRAWS